LREKEEGNKRKKTRERGVGILSLKYADWIDPVIDLQSGTIR
jgi:hypothetical protein